MPAHTAPLPMSSKTLSISTSFITTTTTTSPLQHSLKSPHNLLSRQLPTDTTLALYQAAAAASASDDFDKVELLLAAGGNPNWYSNQEGGQTALHAGAAGAGANNKNYQLSSKIVALLLEHGADVRVLTLPEFNTPLHLASSAGNLESVKMLVEHDATTWAMIKQGNVHGNTPCHEACIQGHVEVVSYLLEREAAGGGLPMLNTLTSLISSNTPRTSTTSTTTTSSSSSSSLINLPNKRGSTPLLFSLYGRNPSFALISLLLERGADLAHVDRDGVGVFHICAMQGHEHLVAFFLAKMKEKEKQLTIGLAADSNGHVPLFYAKMKGYANIVEMLLVAEHEQQESSGKEGERGEEVRKDQE